MTRLQLRPHVSFALVGDRVVFLDLREDRYVMLDPDTASAFEALRCSPDGCASLMHAEILIGTGLFRAVAEPCQHRPAQPPHPESDLPVDLGTPRLTDWVRVLILLLRFRFALQHQSLERIILRRRSKSLGRSGEAPVDFTLALARRFQRARGLIPIPPTCLQDSLALQDWLSARGAPSSLVFGVQLEPFSAHSWVQLGGIVLNDAPDRVLTYTPILVVE